mmetsp:Transcript_60159/g.105759  ORF Transcript_60159/g.105759 Transcript_60159/m.105759 type:complete len:220 (-) Transcript_60159:1004-1663(-)
MLQPIHPHSFIHIAIRESHYTVAVVIVLDKPTNIFFSILTGVFTLSFHLPFHPGTFFHNTTRKNLNAASVVKLPFLPFSLQHLAIYSGILALAVSFTLHPGTLKHVAVRISHHTVAMFAVLQKLSHVHKSILLSILALSLQLTFHPGAFIHSAVRTRHHALAMFTILFKRSNVLVAILGSVLALTLHLTLYPGTLLNSAVTMNEHTDTIVNLSISKLPL